jgi:hypothetical protein
LAELRSQLLDHVREVAERINERVRKLTHDDTSVETPALQAGDTAVEMPALPPEVGDR